MGVYKCTFLLLPIFSWEIYSLKLKLGRIQEKVPVTPLKIGTENRVKKGAKCEKSALMTKIQVGYALSLILLLRFL